jgi:hypothetical protein
VVGIVSMRHAVTIVGINPIKDNEVVSSKTVRIGLFIVSIVDSNVASC